MKNVASILIALSLAVCATGAQAADTTATGGTTATRALGKEGNVALSGQLGGELTSWSWSRDGGDWTLRRLTARAGLALDVFVVENLSVGASIAGSFARWQGPVGERETELGVLPQARIGYLIPISSHVAFWPVARAGYGRSWWLADAPRTDTFVVGLDPQLVVALGDRAWVSATIGAFEYRKSTPSYEGPGFADNGFKTGLSLGLGVVL